MRRMEQVRMNMVFRWLMPFFLGVVGFNILRAVTDLTKDGSFWPGSFVQHIVSMLIVIGICYVYDIAWRYRLRERRYDLAVRGAFIKEYLQVLFSLLIGFNLVVFIGERLSVLYLGDGLIDYMLCNVVFIPLFLLYYTMIRSEIMNRHFTEQALLLEKVRNEKLDTELKYLKAQYHPHFLFNALNTIYFQTKEERAKESIELLADLLRYQLYHVNRIVTIGQEIDFIKSYILFQRQRVSKRLVFTAEYDPELKEQSLHPLLFQPLLENAFKYARGEYRIHLSVQQAADAICFRIENTTDREVAQEQIEQGIGVENLRRRLDLLYPEAHRLTLVRKDDLFIAELTLKT